MKKLLSILFTLVIIASVFEGCSKVTEITFSPDIETGDISVVSFNCAAPWGNLLDGTSGSARVKRFAAYMNAVKPDSIGTQEMNSDWMKKLADLMNDYDSYGVQRGGDENEKKSEMNSIFWLKDKYECIEKNTFWLSETPDNESKYEGAGCNRVCSYVMLKDKETGQIYLHMNTHLDNASDEARVFGAQVIKDKIAQIKAEFQYDFKIVLTGDFNDIEGGNPCNTISEILTSCSTVSPENKKSTYTDWGNLENSGEPIDFIFTDATPADYMILDDTANGFVSDHYGVYATIKF
ncbi:MAG: endonuclease/exonuclease/phosphatase family protein [Eubacterium sp.]|nr:endonuclease/exonuclease/phosphatase family protein [Eubacterium sp.]